MENFETRWKAVEHMLHVRFGKVPDMEAILFLIGLNEVGNPMPQKWSKEQKQDLMHVGVCTLLCHKGLYEFEGKDQDGWPHFKTNVPIDAKGMETQELILKECVIDYFEL